MTKLRGIIALMASAILVAGLSASILTGPAEAKAGPAEAKQSPSLSPVKVTPGVVKMGATVTVRISKFPAKTKVAFVQCDPAQTGKCNIGRPVFKYTNAKGKATAKFKTFAWEGCQKGRACEIGVGVVEGTKSAAGVGKFKFAR